MDNRPLVNWDRRQLILTWWNAASAEAENEPGPEELRDLFVHVLLRVPANHLDRFLQHNVKVVSLFGCLGCVGPVAVPKGLLIQMNVDPRRDGKQLALHVVAHEVAHVVLGHLDSQVKSEDECEREVAQLLNRWGYREPVGFSRAQCYHTFEAVIPRIREALRILKWDLMDATRTRAIKELELATSLLEKGLDGHGQHWIECPASAPAVPQEEAMDEEDLEAGSSDDEHEDESGEDHEPCWLCLPQVLEAVDPED